MNKDICALVARLATATGGEFPTKKSGLIIGSCTPKGGAFYMSGFVLS